MMESHATLRAWAELRMLRGLEVSQLLFRPDQPTGLSVGSDPRAGLRVDARGVAPAHFTLLWDGAHLWLEDPLRLGLTRVDGHTLNEWRWVEGQVRVTFGAAWLVLRSAGPPPSRSVPDFAAAAAGRPASPGAALRSLQTVRTVIPGR